MRICRQCRKEFSPRNRNMVFCGVNCRVEFARESKLKQIESGRVPVQTKTIDQIMTEWRQDAEAEDRRKELEAAPSIIPVGGGSFGHKVRLGHLDNAGRKKQVRRWQVK